MATTYINTPGVQIKEVRLGGAPIAGVGTSIAGFVGESPLDRFKNKAIPVTSKDQFNALYVLADPVNPTNPPQRIRVDPAIAQNSDAVRSTPLSRAVVGFFENGGTLCYVVNEGSAASVTEVKKCLAMLEVIDEITIIAAPGHKEQGIYTELKDQAERTGDRVALLDPPVAPTPPATPAKPNLDSAYAAFYYPQVAVGKVLANDLATEYVTPVGHIAGVYARVDTARGVHKAPANESIRGVLGVEQLVTDAQQDVMNQLGINLLRVFSGNVVIWGARTLSTDTTWRYINIRRLVNYIEESLQEGLRWAVFEPNIEPLRKQVSRSVRDFLTGVWRDGGLFGAAPDDAFYVHFPEVFNGPADRALGKLTLEIGLRAAYPAEFIIIRIGLLTQDENAA